MVGTAYDRQARLETEEVEAVNADERETVEIPRMGTQGVTLPIKTLHAAHTVRAKVVSIPAKRVTIEGTRVVTADTSAITGETIRHEAAEVDERAEA